MSENLEEEKKIKSMNKMKSELSKIKKLLEHVESNLSYEEDNATNMITALTIIRFFGDFNTHFDDTFEDLKEKEIIYEIK